MFLTEYKSAKVIQKFWYKSAQKKTVAEMHTDKLAATDRMYYIFLKYLEIKYTGTKIRNIKQLHFKIKSIFNSGHA